MGASDGPRERRTCASRSTALAAGPPRSSPPAPRRRVRTPRDGVEPLARQRSLRPGGGPRRGVRRRGGVRGGGVRGVRGVRREGVRRGRGGVFRFGGEGEAVHRGEELALRRELGPHRGVVLAGLRRGAAGEPPRASLAPTLRPLERGAGTAAVAVGVVVRAVVRAVVGEVGRGGAPGGVRRPPPRGRWTPPRGWGWRPRARRGPPRARRRRRGARLAAAALFRLREYVITFASLARGRVRAAPPRASRSSRRGSRLETRARVETTSRGNEARASAEGEPRRIGRWRTLASDEAVERARERPSGARACAAASASRAIPPRTFFLSPPTTRSDEAVSCQCSAPANRFCSYPGGGAGPV